VINCKQDNYTINVPATLSINAINKFSDIIDSIDSNISNVIRIDCSRLIHVTSTHIALLWQARKQCENKSIEMHLEQPTSGLIRALQILDLDQFFTYNNNFQNPDQTEIIPQNSLESFEDYSDVFEANVGGIKKAVERFGKFLYQLELPEITRFDLRTIFYEVAFNISMHGNQDGKNEISFTSNVSSRRILMEFTDKGMPFDPTSQITNLDPQEAAKNRQTRGFGLNLIKRLTSKISYNYRDNCENVLTIEKIWSNDE